MMWAAVSAIAALSLAGGALALRDQPGGQGGQGQGRGAPPDLGNMLISGLKNTEGCLGVDSGRFNSGKNAIFAWFEDKEAVKRWYDSEVHRQAMGAVMPGFKPSEKPLQGVPDDYDGPILAIAAITFASPEQQQENGRMFSQISIELYAPLKGGLHIGGTLAPPGLKVPGGGDRSADYAVPEFTPKGQ